MDAVAGAGGWQSIVRNGEVIARDNKSLAPRTAVGTDATGALLWLVVVDGRQPGFSEGMSVSELGGLMKELGCREAANMDGGGSSVMGLAGAGGALRLMNSPSDRLLGFAMVRPLPMILALRLRRPSN
jgi:exopolysaccharide biosynthesis protein